ncbi:MAG: hypothetical protein OEM67_05655 [Thermoleophilia bacterium]|nr:hypothetical protein [Thermoleophilia bacterium]
MKFSAAAIGAAIILGGAVATAAAAPMSIVYSDEESASQILEGGAALSPEDGLFRQDPGAGGVFREGYDHHRLAKVNGHELAEMTVDEMVATLKKQVEGGADILGGESHIVMVDEIGNAFRDPKARKCTKKVTIRGTRAVKIACQNRIKLTKHGWKLVVAKAKPPAKPGRNHPGSRLTEAMKQLDAMPWGTDGESYADRVHFYIAPALVTLVGQGRGKHFTFNKKGTLNIRPGMRGVVGGLARGGGVWLQMYHGNGKAVSSKVWRHAGKRFDSYFKRNGGTGRNVHFMMSGTTTKPRGAKRCTTPMACNWKLAKQGYNKRVLRRGVGVWRAGDQAVEWREEYKRFFAV